ncbi:MAG: hypothetical protein J5747_11005 [Spirochaetaceae bacterium]|nr:hypothetical protein [Spirochaetaceae bacterium]
MEHKKSSHEELLDDSGVTAQVPVRSANSGHANARYCAALTYAAALCFANPPYA